MYHPSKKIGENKRQPISINIEELLDIEELPDQEAMAVVGGFGGTGSYEDRNGLKNISGNSRLLGGIGTWTDRNGLKDISGNSLRTRGQGYTR